MDVKKCSQISSVHHQFNLIGLNFNEQKCDERMPQHQNGLKIAWSVNDKSKYLITKWNMYNWLILL